MRHLHHLMAPGTWKQRLISEGGCGVLQQEVETHEDGRVPGQRSSGSGLHPVVLGVPWRKYPAPGRGLPPTRSPVPGFVIAQESVSACDVARAHVTGAPRMGGRQCSAPACWGLACLCSFCLSAAPLSLGPGFQKPPGRRKSWGPHQSEEVGAEQWAWDASQGGPVHPPWPSRGLRLRDRTHQSS